MIAYHFGSSDRRLFGCYHEPARASAGLGVVVCNPLDSEFFVSHKTVRFLATQLCASGIHVLRFDYFGTGDSDGSDGDVNLDGRVRDATVAIEELEEAGGVTSVGLIGVRAGAVVCAGAATLRAVDRLVLLDPTGSPEEMPVAAEPSGRSRDAPCLVVATQEVDDAQTWTQALRGRGIDASVVRTPGAAYWRFEELGSGVPAEAVRKTVRWLSN